MDMNQKLIFDQLVTLKSLLAKLNHMYTILFIQPNQDFLFFYFFYGKPNQDLILALLHLKFFQIKHTINQNDHLQRIFIYLFIYIYIYKFSAHFIELIMNCLTIIILFILWNGKNRFYFLPYFWSSTRRHFISLQFSMSQPLILVF